MSGDIFRDVEVPGCTAGELEANMTMVVGHPSAMRSGAELKDRIRAAPVIVHSNLSTKKVAGGNFDYFPLPRLAAVAKNNGFTVASGPWATYLEAAALVPSAAFDVRKRIACLDTDGVRYLMQCVSFCDTRICVRPDSVLRMLMPKLIEIEHLESWNEDLEIVLPQGEDAASFEEQLRETATEFEEMMEEKRLPEGMTLHEMLEQLSVRHEEEGAAANAARLVASVTTIVESERAKRRALLEIRALPEAPESSTS